MSKVVIELDYMDALDLRAILNARVAEAELAIERAPTNGGVRSYWEHVIESGKRISPTIDRALRK